MNPKTNQEYKLEHSQNFVKSPTLINYLIDLAQIKPEDIIIEIGPGRGKITQELYSKCKQIIGIEKDKKLFSLLKEKFKDQKQITIYNRDFLSFDDLPKQYKIFSNIPFNITTDIIHKITDSKNIPQEAFLIIQKEAAERFIGTPKITQSATLLQPWFELSIIHRFSKDDFTPIPSVDIVFLKISKRQSPRLPFNDRALFTQFIQYGFNQFKPTLKLNFRKMFSNLQFKILAQNLDFDVDAIPTELNIEQWIGLFEFFKSVVNTEKIQELNKFKQKYRNQSQKVVKSHRTRTLSSTKSNFKGIYNNNRKD